MCLTKELYVCVNNYAGLFIVDSDSIPFRAQANTTCKDPDSLFHLIFPHCKYYLNLYRSRNYGDMLVLDFVFSTPSKYSCPYIISSIISVGEGTLGEVIHVLQASVSYQIPKGLMIL